MCLIGQNTFGMFHVVLCKEEARMVRTVSAQKVDIVKDGKSDGQERASSHDQR